MTKSIHKVRPAGTLKEAQTRLVQTCGGAVRAAALVRVGQSQLHKYTDADEPNDTVHMPVDVVRILETVCKQPHVSRFLAHEAGFVLEPAAAAAGGETERIAAQTAQVAATATELFGDASRALEDGHVDAREAGQIISDIDHLIEQTAALRVAAVGIREGGDDGGEE